VTQLIQAAREYAEHYTGRAFVQRTLELRVSSFTDARFREHAGGIALPFPPLISVSEVSFLDSGGAETIVADTVYDVDTASEPGVVYLAANQFWPYSTFWYRDGVRITYLAGYAPTSSPVADYLAEHVPASLKIWMQQRVVTLYDQASSLVIGTIIQPIPRDLCDGLLDPLIVGTRFGLS
jgi:uncharacterized phiE125 gp8 family phage protein